MNRMSDRFAVSTRIRLLIGIIVVSASLLGLVATPAAFAQPPAQVPCGPSKICFGMPFTGSPFPPPADHDHSGNARDNIVPRNVVIPQGQSVTFEVNGPHHLAIYAAGTSDDDIDTTNVAPPAGPNCPLGAGRIDDDDANSDRIFQTAGCPPPPTFGPVTVVVPAATFTTPGRYLVICQVRAHFLNEMYGWITVR